MIRPNTWFSALSSVVCRIINRDDVTKRPQLEGALSGSERSGAQSPVGFMPDDGLEEGRPTSVHIPIARQRRRS